MMPKEHGFWYPIQPTIGGSKLGHFIKLAEESLKLPGDFAECGVFNGGSAAVLADIVRTRHLYLFDTFEGMPKTHEKDNFLKGGEFVPKISLHRMRELFGHYAPHAVIIKGLVPDSLWVVEHRKFAFVHVDMDIYEPHLAAYEFFWPRMVKGGVLLIDDYGFNRTEGVTAATDEFFNPLGVEIEPLANGQAMVKKS